MNCTFVFPCKDSKFLTVSLISAIWRALSCPPRSSHGSQLGQIVASAKTSGSVVVIFGEGITSNGRGLLPWETMMPLSGVDKSSNVFPAALRYTPPYVTTPLPVNFFQWALSVLWAWACSVRIRFGSPMARNQNDELANSEIADVICRIGRLRKLGGSLGSESKREFIDAWHKGRGAMTAS